MLKPHLYPTGLGVRDDDDRTEPTSIGQTLHHTEINTFESPHQSQQQQRKRGEKKIILELPTLNKMM